MKSLCNPNEVEFTPFVRKIDCKSRIERRITNKEIVKYSRKLIMTSLDQVNMKDYEDDLDKCLRYEKITVEMGSPITPYSPSMTPEGRPKTTTINLEHAR